MLPGGVAGTSEKTGESSEQSPQKVQLHRDSDSLAETIARKHNITRSGRVRKPAEWFDL